LHMAAGVGAEQDLLEPVVASKLEE